VVADTTSLPPAPYCPEAATYPTSSAGYGIPIANRIVNGVLTQGQTKITNINATVCGLLQFPSLSADIPASSITYVNSGSGQAKVTVAGLGTGTAVIQASGPSTAVTSDRPAPNGGLIFTLTAETSSVLTVSLAGIGPGSCRVDLAATFNTNPAAGGSALVGPLTGAQGTAYAGPSNVRVSNLTPASPGNPVDQLVCTALNTALDPSRTPATFKAPLDFYSTLTSF
jgi:hypothetical protein